MGRKGIIIHPEEWDDVWEETIANLGLNTLGLHPVGGTTAHLSLQRAIDTFDREKIRRMNRRGVEVDYEAHVMKYLLPEELFAQHPNWFRMDETGNRTSDFNLCPSNKDALDVVAKRAEMLSERLDTGTDRYFFWMDDVTGKKCNCERCKALSASDQAMVIANAMLKGIRRRNPDAKLCYLSYADALQPPKVVEPEKGIFLEYAPIMRDSNIPLFDPTCEKNLKESAPIDSLLRYFGNKDAQVLEYWVDNSRFSGWKKPPKQLILDEDVMRQDVSEYRKRGFEHITSFGCYLGSDYRALWGMPPIEKYAALL